jgi:aryl-alcohol dehydrogenase-like predicted oxidoreductase
MEVMSRIVLGGPSLSILDQPALNKFLAVAEEAGIQRIDTRREYNGLQVKIGVYLKGKDKFVVNSKVGNPFTSELTPLEIQFSVEKSLKELGIERIGTLFLHSLHKSSFTEENILKLDDLQRQGKISRFGYSGDGEDLAAAIGVNEFQDLMLTCNVLDQENLDLEKSIEPTKQIYFKIPLAQAIWRTLEFQKRVASLSVARMLFKKPALPDSWLDYKARFGVMKDVLHKDEYFEDFLKFALFYGNARQFVTIGTTSLDHLRKALSVENLGADTREIDIFRAFWLERRLPSWSPHL